MKNGIPIPKKVIEISYFSEINGTIQEKNKGKIHGIRNLDAELLSQQARKEHHENTE
jgi:hypothetical protein